MSLNQRKPECSPSAEDAWATLQALYERVARALARGDDYDLLVSASRDAEALLARHAEDSAIVGERNGHLEDGRPRKAA